MQATKKWNKTGDGRFELMVNDELAGHLHIDSHDQSRATFFLDKKIYTIRRTGFWKNNFEILAEDGTMILKTSLKKWYANHYEVAFGEKILHLQLRNNPLAEWVIKEGETELLSYGLKADKENVFIGIHTASENNELVLDMFVWYLFAPIAHENTGDEFVFRLLLMAQ